MKKSLTYWTKRPEPEVELWARLTTPTPGNSERSEDVKDLETHHDPLLVMTCTDQSGMEPIQHTNDSPRAISRAFCGLRCPEAQLCLQHFALLSCPPPLPWLCDAKTPQKRGERMERERNGEVLHQDLHWKDRFGKHHIQREKPGMRGTGKFCLLLSARARAGVGERQRALWKHPNLLSESKRQAAAEDRTAWKEWMCSETQALDAKLRCLTACQGRAWAPWATGMSVWTQRWEVSRWLQSGSPHGPVFS